MCNTLAFDEGRAASEAGQSKKDNPYDIDEDLGEDREIGERFMDWRDGWVSYKRENDLPGDGV